MTSCINHFKPRIRKDTCVHRGGGRWSVEEGTVAACVMQAPISTSDYHCRVWLHEKHCWSLWKVACAFYRVNCELSTYDTTNQNNILIWRKYHKFWYIVIIFQTHGKVSLNRVADISHDGTWHVVVPFSSALTEKGPREGMVRSGDCETMSWLATHGCCLHRQEGVLSSIQHPNQYQYYCVPKDNAQ